MATKKKNLSKHEKRAYKEVEQYSIGLVVSDWNPEITGALADGAVASLEAHGVLSDNITRIAVPGAFELPFGARVLLKRHKLDAVICIGCVIKGETAHNEYINHAVSSGITNLGLTAGIPVVYGVLTPNDMQQALDRAGGEHGNKGVEAAVTALQMAELNRTHGLERKTIGF